MSLFLVRPPSAPAASGAEYAWVRASEDGANVVDQGRAPLALLPSAPDVVVLVPGPLLSWQRLSLPPGSLGNAARLRAVIEGLLEERLLDEAEGLHFALEPGARAGEPIWVAVCERAWLREAVAAVEGSGRRVTRIAPEFAPRPEDSPPLLFVTGEGEDAQFTLCDGNGVMTLPLTPTGLGLVTGSPADTWVASSEPGAAAQAEALLGQRLPIAQRAQRWLAAAQGPWDLAQFELASSGRARAGKKLAAGWQALRHAPRWRAARWGVVVLVAAQLLGLNAWAWKERRALDAKRDAIRGVLTQTFPQVKLVVDPPVQMQREVAALRQAAGNVAPPDLEPTLAAVAGALPAGRVPTAIDYSSGQLRLRGLQLNPQEMQALVAALAPRGYQARGEGELLLVQAEAQR